MVKRLIRGIVLRWRLWKVCRKLNIRPYKFQRQYALHGHCKWPDGRRNGKTMAVALWGLIRNVVKPKDVYTLAQRDPDMWATRVMRDVFSREYRQLVQRVKEVKER